MKTARKEIEKAILKLPKQVQFSLLLNHFEHRGNFSRLNSEDSFFQFVLGSFIWSDTEEGLSFWYKISNK